MKVGVEVQGLKPVLRTLTKLGPELNREIREAAGEIAADEAVRVRQAAAASDKLSAAVGATVAPRRDRLPAIAAGGAKRLPVKGRPKASQVVFGAEFGGRKRKTTQQFRPHLKKTGYWMWPTIREDQERMLIRWTEAANAAIRKASQ